MKLFKYVFDAKKIKFLKLIVNQFSVSINFTKVEIIIAQLVSKDFWDIQMFLRFTNFYCWFIEAFNKVAVDLLDMLKGSTKGISEAWNLFLQIKPLSHLIKSIFFVYTLILVYYNLMHHVMLEYNIFRFVILAILLQLIEKTGQRHFIAFWLRKIIPIEWNYRVEELKMLTVVESCKH